MPSRMLRYLLLAALIVTPAAFAREDSAVPQAFRDAYYQETHEANPAAAIELYEQVLQSDASATVKAEAKTRVAACREEVKAADLASLMPPETIVYVQFGNPGQHLANVVRMIGLDGNPLANIGGPSWPIEGGEGAVIPKTLRISPAILDSISRFRGAAGAITGFDPAREAPSGVLVLHPGDADLLRGFIETAAQFGPAGEPIAGFPTLSIPCDGMNVTVAFTARLVVVGTDRALLEGAIDRLTSDTAASLSTVPAFTEQTAARDGALLYAFVNAQEALKTLYGIAQQDRSMIKPMAMAQALFDPGHMRSISLALGSSQEGLGGELVVNMDEEQANMVYNLLRTPPMKGHALKLVPASAAAVFAFGLNPDSTPEAGNDVMTKTQTVRTITGLDLARELFANVREVAVFVTPAAGDAAGKAQLPSVGLAMVVANVEKSEALWEFLLSLPSRFSGQPDAKPETKEISGKQVQVYDMPEGVRIHLARTESAMVIGLTEQVIAQTLDAVASGRSIMGDEQMQPATTRVTGDTSVALVVHAGRVMNVMQAFAPQGDAQVMRQIAGVAGDTMLTVLIDESQTRFRIAGRLSGLPKVDDVLKVLADSGVFGRPGGDALAADTEDR